eukprot:2399399-Amphidinium_carterae.1
MGDSGEELCARKQHLAAARLCYETDDATSRQEEYLAWLSTQGVAMRNGCISQVLHKCDMSPKKAQSYAEVGYSAHVEEHACSVVRWHPACS